MSVSIPVLIQIGYFLLRHRLESSCSFEGKCLTNDTFSVTVSVNCNAIILRCKKVHFYFNFFD